MFIDFFYKLREVSIPVNPTSFLTLQKAINSGLVGSLDDFYTVARTVLVKSEKYFDLYDQVFAHVFQGTALPETDDLALDFLSETLLQEWLQNPKSVADSFGVDEEKLRAMSPEDLLDYFKERLKEQQGRHDGGSKWIGTGGTSPVGHSGHHPGGMRVGGKSESKSGIQVAAERRYRDYSTEGPLTQNSMGEALKRLRHLVPRGARDQINVDASIYQTMKNGGEIELVFDQGIVDRLKIILAIDNGGWSMEPYVNIVQTLFTYSKSQFKDLKTYFFHNTIYDYLWEDPGRYSSPVRVDELVRLDPDTRLILIGDASMAPYELMAADGSIYAMERSGIPSIESLRFLSQTFVHSIWLNPTPRRNWGYTRTISVIENIFPMFELSLDGLEKGVSSLMG